MSEESQLSCITGDAAFSFNDASAAPLDRLRQVSTSIKSMDAPGKCVTPLYISVLSLARGTAVNTSLPRSPLHAGKWLPDVKAESGIKRQRPVMKRGLHQPYAHGASLICSIHYGLHQLAANAH